MGCSDWIITVQRINISTDEKEVEELFAVKELGAKMKKYDDKRKALEEVRLEGALIYSPEQKEEYEAKRKVLEEAYDDALKNYTNHTTNGSVRLHNSIPTQNLHKIFAAQGLA